MCKVGCIVVKNFNNVLFDTDLNLYLNNLFNDVFEQGNVSDNVLDDFFRSVLNLVPV